nr:hypothetical protein [Streptomyces chartreusis]
MADRDRLKVQYNYSPAGTLKEVTDATTSPTKALFTTSTVNADGQILTGSYSGGVILTTRDYYNLNGRLKNITDQHGSSKLTDTAYAYYDNGSLKQRSDSTEDSTNPRIEDYTYDHLGRLDTWQLNPAGTTAPSKSTTYGYSTSGNLETVRTVTGTTTTTQTNHYDNTAHPNAVSSRTITGSPDTDFTYDDHGRQLTGDGRTLTYRGLQLTPRTITKSGTTWTYTYDASGHRFKKTNGTNSTLYIGSLYEKRTTPSGTSHVFHINGPAGHIAQITYTGTTGRDTQYTLNDPQNTTTTVTNATATATERQYFDPYGARINKNGTTTPTPTPPTNTTRATPATKWTTKPASST